MIKLDEDEFVFFTDGIGAYSDICVSVVKAIRDDYKEKHITSCL